MTAVEGHQQMNEETSRVGRWKQSPAADTIDISINCQ